MIWILKRFFRQQPKPTKISIDIVNQIRADYLKTRPDNKYTVNDVHLDYYGEMDNGDMLVYTEIKGSAHFGEVEYINLGDYMYVSSSKGREVKIYRDNKFYTIKEVFEDENTSKSYKDSLAYKLNLMEIYKGDATKDILECYLYDFTMSFLVRNKEPVKAIIKKNVDFLLEIFVEGKRCH